MRKSEGENSRLSIEQDVGNEAVICSNYYVLLWEVLGEKNYCTLFFYRIKLLSKEDVAEINYAHMSRFWILVVNFGHLESIADGRVLV